VIIRTARAREASFSLLEDKMVERCWGLRYYLNRKDLKKVLPVVSSKSCAYIAVGLLVWGETGGYIFAMFRVVDGKTQRGKKFIRIGCKHFVGENRRKLIAWAKAAP
jgi:hypothetical protein